MTPTDRRTACIRALAEIDQRLAEAEERSIQPDLGEYEQEYFAENLELRRDARSRIEAILERLEANE